MSASEPKNLIFDLGGVILDLSVDHTLEAFASLSGMPKDKVTELFHSSPEFNEYERGGIDDDAFRKFLKTVYALDVTDATLDSSWNAMLRAIPKKKLMLLQELKQSYNVYLLSNTNEIHLKYINNVLLPQVTEQTSLDQFFHKAYYSHRLLKRKPDPEIFRQVLEENNMIAEETLFLDDNALNIEGAASVGIRTAFVDTPNFILDYFNA